MEKIQHFSHKHALTFFQDIGQGLKKLVRWKIVSSKCSACSQVADDNDYEGYYFCETCGQFWLHKSCFLLPHELQHHPLHSSHPFTLIAKPPGPKLYRFGFSSLTYFICDECRDICPGFAYHCAECQFYLDVKCAQIITDDHGRDQHHESSRQLLDAKPEMCHPSHTHQLIFFNFPRVPTSFYKCRGCEKMLQDLVYGCFDCEHFLHKSCAEMPLEIQQHPYHPQHPLLLHYDGRKGRKEFICDGCRCISSGFAFQCEHCQIKLDVKCALLTEGSLGKRSEECEINSQISHFSHHHTLLLFNNVKDLECDGCRLTISGLFYGCLDCGFYLHKFCAEILKEIRHSYHPFHPLHAQTLDFVVEVDHLCDVCKYPFSNEEIVY